MATPTAKELQAKVDRGAMIADMSAALKTASDRWAEVCRIYEGAWKAAHEEHVRILDVVKNAKVEREEKAKAGFKLCIDLAGVFLPMLGGPAAIAMAPILTARGKLWASTAERVARADWSAFATSRPVLSQVVKEIGTRSAKAAQDAATKIKDDIIKKMEPKYVRVKAVPDDAKPLDAFTDNNNLTRGEMNVWVQSCAKWNLDGGWERELIPIAHELFLNHPWIATAPPEKTTQDLRAQLTLFLELALWLRWGRSLHKEYWLKVHEWYVSTYSRLRTRDGKRAAVRDRRRWVVDALDFSVIWVHLGWALGRKREEFFDKMTLENPEAGIGGGERDTIDMWVLAHAGWYRSPTILKSLLPTKRIDPQLLEALSEM